VGRAPRDHRGIDEPGSRAAPERGSQCVRSGRPGRGRAGGFHEVTMSPVPPPLPIERFLTPDPSLAIPAGVARAPQDLPRGLPFQFPRDGTLSLILLVPTGYAVLFRDTDPATVASAGAAESAPHLAPRGEDPEEQPPLRLLLRDGARTLATIPLAA